MSQGVVPNLKSQIGGGPELLFSGKRFLISLIPNRTPPNERGDCVNRRGGRYLREHLDPFVEHGSIRIVECEADGPVRPFGRQFPSTNEPEAPSLEVARVTFQDRRLNV